jgi:hypothetical protein
MAVTVNDIIQIPITNTAIQWAMFTSMKKFPYTVQGMRNRPPLVKLDDLFRGDLAKNAMIEYLHNNGVNIVEEYDRSRTDNYKNPNSRQWHFRTQKHRFEVNSSLIPTNRSANYVVNNFDIKVTVERKNGIVISPTNLSYDVALQLYYHNVPPVRGFIDTTSQNRIRNEEVEVIEELLNIRNRYRELYFYAWITTTEIEQFRLSNVALGNPPTYVIPTTNREYWDCKIRNCYTPRTLVPYL